jgi:Zn finger protein HypA/HybF involved in hydrogenase expression
MNKYQEALDFIIDHTHPMCETMKDLEALDFSYNILQELVDKETPMKPKYISLLTNPPKHKVVCSNCHGPYLERVFKFCPNCGHRIDWSKNV